MSDAHSSPLQRHRRRQAGAGLRRVEVQAAPEDGRLLQVLAARLRTGDADRLRQRLGEMLDDDREPVLEAFGSSLPDEAFDCVFDQHRSDRPRTVPL